MDTRILVAPADIELGDKLTQALRADTQTDLKAAMWWYEEAAEQMRFLVATPLYISAGPRKTYLRLNEVIKASGVSTAAISLWAVAPDHPVVTTMRRFTTPEATHIAFENCQFDELHIPFAFIYFVGKTRASTRKKRT